MTEKFYDYQAMWAWVDINENRRRIRYMTLTNTWEWIDKAGKFHAAQDNTFSGAVLDAWWAEK